MGLVVEVSRLYSSTHGLDRAVNLFLSDRSGWHVLGDRGGHHPGHWIDRLRNLPGEQIPCPNLAAPCC